jgi:hypothetical protein
MAILSPAGDPDSQRLIPLSRSVVESACLEGNVKEDAGSKVFHLQTIFVIDGSPATVCRVSYVTAHVLVLAGSALVNTIPVPA